LPSKKKNDNGFDLNRWQRVCIGFDIKRISASNSDRDYATVTRFKIVSFVFGGVWQERAIASGETRLAVEKITAIRPTYYQQPLALDEPVKRGVILQIKIAIGANYGL
jgi:hypothetical protein